MKRKITVVLATTALLSIASIAAAVPKHGCIAETVTLACFENGNPTPSKLVISGRDLATDQIIDKNERTITDLRDRERDLDKKNSDLEATVARLVAENAEFSRKLSQLGSFFNEVQVKPEAKAAAGPENHGTVNSKKQPIALHKRPDGDSPVAGKLKAGARVEIISSQDGWYQVRSGSQAGFVRKSLIAVD